MKEIVGKWRIVEMELWDQDAVDLVAPGFIEFNADQTGSLGFIAVQGWIDWRLVERDNRDGVEFSWDGVDDNDRRSGRGWAVIDEDDSMRGRFFFHMGDDSEFRAVRRSQDQRPAHRT